MRIMFVAILSALLCPAVWAADVSGKWKAEYTSPEGTVRTSLFDFHVDGQKLTGTIASTPGGTSEISNGVVSDNQVTFYVIRQETSGEVKVRFTGKVVGDELNLRVEWNDGEGGFNITAKRLTH